MPGDSECNGTISSPRDIGGAWERLKSRRAENRAGRRGCRPSVVSQKTSQLLVSQLQIAGLSVMDQNLTVKPISERSRDSQRNIFVIARVLGEAPVMLKQLASGPPGSKQLLFDLPGAGGIPGMNEVHRPVIKSAGARRRL